MAICSYQTKWLKLVSKWSFLIFRKEEQLAFFEILNKNTKNGCEIYPQFKVEPSHDIMVRGKDFYAVWDEDIKLWSTDEFNVARIVDTALWSRYEELKSSGYFKDSNTLIVKTMTDFSSNSWSTYKRFISQYPNNYVPLDSHLIFADQETKKEDYASKKLPYSLSDAPCPAWDELSSTLYDPSEKRKIEWAIGSIIAGDSKYIQKFLVLYGQAGTGKSTILNIIQMIFDGYYCTFDARSLANSSNQFSMEVFKDNPLVAIQHDGDLSHIEDNTKLNSIISHEEMIINEKRKSLYTIRMQSFLFMGTNKPVKITDGKSGLIRRLIDVNPSGRLLDADKYNELMNQIQFEIGAIANHCKEVYKQCGKHYYDHYRSTSMQYKTNVFYNFVDENYFIFRDQDGVSLKQAYALYKEYSQTASLQHVMPMHIFREELKNYFTDFSKRVMIDGETYHSYYSGFRHELFSGYSEPIDMSAPVISASDEIDIPEFLNLTLTESLFDVECQDCLAQYANEEGFPFKKWVDVKGTLKSLNTMKLHYVRIPENHIVIDFDICGEDGHKSLEKNIEAARDFPPTYAELSKSGNGLHLHYIYDGDSTRLSRLYSTGIEVKVFSGLSSLRRKLTFCNGVPIAHISGGLPLKEKKMTDKKTLSNEKSLRELIKRNLRKEIHPATKPSIDFIYKILDDAYNSDLSFDISDMEGPILAFAANSTNQSAYCIKTVGQMRFKSKDRLKQENGTSLDRNVYVEKTKEPDLVFFDIEVFPNLLLVNYKKDGDKSEMNRMINPEPKDIEKLFNYRLVGYNNRRYDNHILYGRWLGKSLYECYKQSQAIIDGTKEEKDAAMYPEAYNISYTDIYDFASAGNKMSLKSAEIEMGIHHQELGMDWTKPVPEDRWEEVSEYCDNDVLATEARFHYLKGDWTARQILADLTKMSVNDSTNSLSTRFIFDKNKKPQSEFNYRDIGAPIVKENIDKESLIFLNEACPEMMATTHPVRTDLEWDTQTSALPYFPGYEFSYVSKTVAGKKITKPLSTYRDEEIGEGGYVYAEPGMYTDIALLDITSMHPHSIIAECLFGPRYTKRFRDIVMARVYIKHEDWDALANILDGQLMPYVEKIKNGEMTSKDLAGAMKTIINSVYGQTDTPYPNPFRDPRNKDNIVAKRGALFMVDLKHEVQKRGFTVAHVKTDSIKIPNATPSIIDFVYDFGKKYGYNFELEAVYDRFCLINKAVYIARYKDGPHAGQWTATGAQLAQPYVFKTLFSHEPVVFDDLCETKNAKSAIYLDMNEDYAPHLYTEEEYDAEIERIVNLEIEKEMRKTIRKSDAEIDILKKEITKDAVNKYKGPAIGDLVETHNYKFIGRAGQFTPVVEGAGGGCLVREQNGTMVNVTDTSSYRWLESEVVRNLHMEDAVDYSYYRNKVDKAVETLSKYGDVEWFLGNDVDPN